MWALRVTWSEESLAGELVMQRSLFTGMTGFGTVLRFDDKVDIVNRRASKGRLLRGDF